MAAGLTVAVTGATGFLGRHVVTALGARGNRVRLLVRREPLDGEWNGMTPDVVLGSLSDRQALARLVDGVDAVLHLAGAIKARDDAEFLAVNRDGSRALAEAAAAAPSVRHFVHVSSLAARHPELSGYAASKRASEDAVFAALGADRVSVIRPPAIYGPGDRETLVFFQLASRKLVPVPGSARARISLIHVHEAARLLADGVAGAPSGGVQVIADGCADGYGWREILDAAAAAVGNRAPRYFSVPGGLLRGIGSSVGAVASFFGQSGMVNAGKIRELLHEDWSVSAVELRRSPDGQTGPSLLSGFAETAVWYRRAGWL